MTENPPDTTEPPRARKVPQEEVAPQNVLTRQDGLAAYLIRRARRRRQRFLYRAGAVPIRTELLRNLYLVGCILFDALIVPEPIFLLQGYVGWILAGAAFAVALWIEYRVYLDRFALPEPADHDP